MRYYTGPALAERLIVMFNVEDARAELLIEEAVRRMPASMRVIHDLAYLLYRDDELGAWFTGRNGPLGSPRELLENHEEGVEIIEQELMDVFRASAPRDLFPLEGKPTVPPFECQILIRILHDRSDPSGPEDRDLHDPTQYERRPIARVPEKLARAVVKVANDSDSEFARAVVIYALADEAPIVRVQAVWAARGLLGFSEVTDAITMLRDDEEVEVRLAAVDALRQFVVRPEVSLRVAEFVNDNDRRVRVAALKALSAGRLPEEHRLNLVPLAFDAASEVREATAGLFSQDELLDYLDGLADLIASGEPINTDETARFLRAEIYPSEEKADSIVQRIKTIAGAPAVWSPERIVDIADIYVALKSWPGNIPDEIWAAIALAGVEPKAHERPLSSLLMKTKGMGAWPVVIRLLRRPLDEHSSIRASIAETAASLAAGHEEMTADLLSIARDRNLSCQARGAVLWGISKLPFDEAVQETAHQIASDDAESEFLVRDAIRLLVAGVGPEGILALLRRTAKERDDRAGREARLTLEQAGLPLDPSVISLADHQR